MTPNRPRASSVDPRRKFENFDTFSPSVVNTNGYEDYGGRRGGGGGGGRGGGGGGGGGGNQHILVGHQNQRLDTSPSRDGVDSAEKMQAKPARKAWKYEYDIDDFQIHGGKKSKSSLKFNKFCSLKGTILVTDSVNFEDLMILAMISSFVEN